jgi:hypothetical protein
LESGGSDVPVLALLAVSDAVWVAAIAAGSTVVVGFIPVLVLIMNHFMKKGLKQNTEEHGETKALLTDLHTKIDDLDVKIDNHITWHAEHPAQNLAPVIVLHPTSPPTEAA